MPTRRRDIEFKHAEPGIAVELNSQGLKLPEGFPADVATPEQSKLISAINLDKADVYTFETEASQSVQQVLREHPGEDAVRRLARHGFVERRDCASLAFKKDARMATYSISKQQEAVAVMLNLKK